jgi:hypothetical protein
LRGVIWKAAGIGAAHGAAECAVLFLTSDRRTLANDWFLAVMVVFANATGFAIAARYSVNLIGVAIAGLAGMMIGGWVGVHTLGSYEYTVPTPREDRELRIIAKGQERVIEMKGVPEETVKRIPIGGGLGILVGFAVGGLVYARLRRPQGEGPGETYEVPDAEPDSAPDRRGG